VCTAVTNYVCPNNGMDICEYSGFSSCIQMLTYANAHKGSAHTVIVYTESRLYPKTKN